VSAPEVGTRARSEHGFSLIEALVSMTIFLFVLIAVLSIYSQSHRLYAHGERTADVQDNGRLAMAEMVRQIRLAGFFPENFGGAPPNPLLANPLHVASDGAVAIHGDADGSGVTQVFLFCVQDGALRRAVGPAGDDASYDCASGETLAQNVTGLRFTYYDENGDPVPDPPTAPFDLDDQSPGSAPDMSDATERDSIRRVVVTLTLRRQISVNHWQEYPLVSNVWLRNAS